MKPLRKVGAGGTALLAIWLAAALAWPVAAAPAKPDVEVKFEEIRWEALVPKGWDPAKQFKAMDLSKLQDGDTRAMDALQALKKAYDNAPAEGSLHGRKIRIPGYVLPLDQSGESVKSFLLVPYFGACIHTPPPPANQIIQVTLVKPQKDLRSMDAVWVSGTLEVFRSDSPWGAAGYRLAAQKVEAYK